MKGYEIETKDEKSQMYLENNLNEIKNNMIFTINVQGFFSILLIKKKRILTTKYFQLKLMALKKTILKMLKII